VSSATFADVVGDYRSTYMITDLKVTTRRGGMTPPLDWNFAPLL